MARDKFGAYSRAVRKGAKVVRQYFGRGRAADAAERLHRRMRADRQARRNREKAAAAAHQRVATAIERCADTTEWLMRGWLMTQGYYRNNRGPWRRRGGLELMATTESQSAKQSGHVSASVSSEDYVALAKLADSGDQEALHQLGQLFDESPEIVERIGSMSHAAEITLLQHIAGSKPSYRELLRRNIQRLREKLACEDDDEVARLAVHRVVLCATECDYLTTVTPVPRTPIEIRQRVSAERRLERAMRSLQTLRKISAEVARVKASPRSWGAPRLRVRSA